ncbi:MAG TPA: hypothetical protein VH854_02835 [Thermoanaerobaculia bacterium]|jgi:DUF4097 and DUF4098 domain-containing protein YvlB|nr:hypothetical protein [Thermoanaerobaculia bacterium]
MLPNRALALAGLAVTLAAAPLLADNRLEKDLALEPGGRFSIETDAGKVVLTGSNDSGVHIVVTSKNKDLDEILTFRFDEGAGSASVVARRKHKWSMFSGWHDNVEWQIRVPAQTRVSIDTSGGAIDVTGLRDAVKLETSGGGIHVRDLVGSLDCHTSGGGITLNDVKGTVKADTSGGGVHAKAIDGPVHAESSGGSIELDGVTGDIDADTSGGGIRITDAGGKVRADTSGGGIEATFAKGNSNGGTLETSGGGIEVTLDSAADLSIEASGNAVRTDLPLRVHGEISRGSLSGTLGRGGNLLKLHTSGGSVRIQGL